MVSPTSGIGGSTVNVSFTIKNQGAGAAGTSTCNVRINTSTANVTTSDPLLLTVSVPSLAAGQSAYVNHNVTIPSGQTVGQNFVWVIEDVNNTAGQGTANEANDKSYTPFTVTAALPDLITQSLVVSPTSGNGGSTVNVSFTIKNQGTGTAGTSTCNVRINTSTANVTTSDPLLLTVSVPSLSAGQTAYVNQNVTIPSGQTVGQNYVWVIEDVNNTAGQGTANEANDKSYTPFTVTAALPDLITQSLVVSPTSGNGGSTVNVSFTIYNQGTGTAGTSTCNVRINTSTANVTTSDPLLLTVSVPSLAAGQSAYVNQNVTIPSGQTVGQNYVWVIEDVNNTAGQGTANEANDKSYTPFTVTAASTYSISPNPASVNENAGSLTFTISRSSTSAAATVYASTVQDQGTVNTNNNYYYVGVSNQVVNFPAGQSTAQVSVTINDRGLTSGSEVFRFIVQQNSTDPISTSLATDNFTINNNDAAGTYSISPNPASVNENAGSLTFTISRSSTSAAATVYASTVQDQGTVNTNNNYYYVGVSNQVVNFSAGQSTAQVSVTINDRGLTSGSEVFRFIVQQNSTDPITASLATDNFTIYNNDAGANYSISPNPASVNENAGHLTFTITRSSTSAAATVYASTVQDQGTVNTNNNYYYVGVSNQVVNFSSGQSTAQVTVTINDLGRTSGSETFRFIVQQNSTDPVTTSLATDNFTILNNDGSATLTVTSPNGSENWTAGNTYNVAWTVSGVTSQINYQLVAYSTDNFATYTNVSSALTPGTRSFNWTVPGTLHSSTVKVRVRALDINSYILAQDISDNYFTISAPSVQNPVAVATCDNHAPNSGQTVNFSSSGSYDPNGGCTINSNYWTFGDGATSSSPYPSHAYSAAAGSSTSYPVTLQVTDSCGHSGTTSFYIYVTGQALGNNNSTEPTSKDPVNLATGNYIYNHVDLQLPGRGLPFEFQRYYNSKATASTGTPLGFGWTHSYNIQLSIVTNNTVVIAYGDGHQESYATNGAGGYISEPGIYNVLTTSGGNYTLTTKEQQKFNFNASGQITSIVDKNSNTVSLAYTGNNLTTVTDTVNRVIHFAYNANNCLTNITDPLGRTVQFAYDANTNLIRATDTRVGLTQFGYDQNHQMTNAIDPRGNTFVSMQYDSQKRVVTSQSDALQGVTTFNYNFSYDPVNGIGLTTVTDAMGNVSFNYYDKQLRVIETLDNMGNQQFFQYDTNNNRIQVIDKNGNSTAYAYDANGNVISKTDPFTSTTTIAYDALNNPTNRLDALTGRTVFRYDTKGNLTNTFNSLGKTNTYQYDAFGEPVVVTDANGNSTTNTYDCQRSLKLTHLGSKWKASN